MEMTENRLEKARAALAKQRKSGHVVNLEVNLIKKLRAKPIVKPRQSPLSVSIALVAQKIRCLTTDGDNG